MALTNTIAWRVRTGGNNVNGGGFDYATTNITAVTAQGSGGGGSILSGDTTLTVSGHAGWPASGNYYARLGPTTIYGPGAESAGGSSEIVQVTAGQGTNSWTVTRGALGTTALNFAANTTIDNCLAPCNTAAFSGSVGTSTASTTFADAAGAFNETVVGNVLWLASGTGTPTAGAYLVTGFTNSTTITLDRASGTYTAGAWKIGGAWADFKTNTQANPPILPGHVIYVRGSGSASVGSPDYTVASHFGISGGDSTNGYVALVGEHGRTYVSSTENLCIFGNNQIWVENFYWISGGTGFASHGIIDSVTECTIYNCIFDQNGNDVQLVNFSGSLVGCELFSTSGSGGSNAAVVFSANNGLILGCNIHDAVGPGIAAAPEVDIVNSIIAKCHGDAITLGSNQSVISCTIDGNTGHGIVIGSGSVLQGSQIIGNNITNQTGAGKKGISVTGTVATNDRIRNLIDFNWFFNNTADVGGITEGGVTQIRGHTYTDSVGVDPGYTGQSTENYAISGNPIQPGYPGLAFLQSKAGQTTGVRSYMSAGGVQPNPAAGGGSVPVGKTVC